MSPTMILQIIFLYTKKGINLKVWFFIVTNESKDIHDEVLIYILSLNVKMCLQKTGKICYTCPDTWSDFFNWSNYTIKIHVNTNLEEVATNCGNFNF